MTLLVLLPLLAVAPRVLDATAYGLVADGVTDDGPAIQRLLGAVDGPAVLRFAERRTMRVLTAPGRYVFDLDGRADLTLDGGGCTFLLGPDLRFLRVRNSQRISVRSLNVDFSPLPFADGVVTKVDAESHCLEVRLNPGFSAPQGGPTHEDGEQAFFGLLWHDGPYGLLSRHYWTAGIAPTAEPNTVRVRADDHFKEFGDIVPGQWRLSLPVPGIAHRYGPGPCFDLHDNDTLTCEDVELWSAPWFGFSVFRNSGDVTFRRVNVRPKPGSGRLLSTWRDGFHVKGNRGKLRWESCWFEGMGDDALNLSTHCSRVMKVLSPTRIEVLQNFPLNPMPWQVGETCQTADFATRTLFGSAEIVGVEGWRTERRVNGKPAASPVVLELEHAIEGLDVGALVWQPESANPDTMLTDCTIRMSCRLQSPVTFDHCEVTALLWFYSERVEGPFPSDVTVRDCVIRRGRGNPRLAVTFAGRTGGSERPSAIHDVRFEHNQVWGDASFVGIDGLQLLDNQFLEPGAKLRLEGNRDAEARANVGAALP